MVKVETTPAANKSYVRGTWWIGHNTGMPSDIMFLLYKEGKAILVGLDGTWYSQCQSDIVADIENMIKINDLRPFNGEIKITV
jgi:hypothetical protein